MFRFAVLSTLLLVGAVGASLDTNAEPQYTFESALPLEELQRKWGSDWAFSGISTFGHLDHVHCLTKPDGRFDIAIIGTPFDSAVTYRPGAWMGPRAIRTASARHLPSRSFHQDVGLNPYRPWTKVIGCGDIPITPIDNAVALRHMTEGGGALRRPPRHASPGILPKQLGDRGGRVQPRFHVLEGFERGLVLNGSSVHAGLRTRLSGTDWATYAEDDRQGYLRISTAGIVARIRERAGAAPACLSIGIDVLDPAFAPAPAPPESGGWSFRELLRMLPGLRDLNIVGADIVEVAPAYDNLGGDTAFTAASLAYEIITSWVLSGLNPSVDVPQAARPGSVVTPGLKTEL